MTQPAEITELELSWVDTLRDTHTPLMVVRAVYQGEQVAVICMAQGLHTSDFKSGTVSDEIPVVAHPLAILTIPCAIHDQLMLAPNVPAVPLAVELPIQEFEIGHYKEGEVPPPIPDFQLPHVPDH